MTGSSEAPDSSQNTMTARRRRALPQILGPVVGHPAGDGLLVAFDRTAGGALFILIGLGIRDVANRIREVASRTPATT